MSVQPVSQSSNPVQTSNTQATNSSGAANDSSLQSIESTFLTLLVQELQNQDPTAPMDSTQMVGQMISLNQLDQLASINQVVTNALGSGSAASTGATSNSTQGIASTN